MCNTYVCVLYHSSYMSSVTRMWISSIWLSKNTPVDALKIHITRSDPLLLRKTSIVFLPMCPDILIVFYQHVCCPNRLVCGGCTVSPQKMQEENLTWTSAGANWVLWLMVGRSCCLHQGKRTLEGLNTKASQTLLLLLCDMEEFSYSTRLEGRQDEILKAQWEKHFWGYSHCCILLWSL